MPSMKNKWPFKQKRLGTTDVNVTSRYLGNVKFHKIKLFDNQSIYRIWSTHVLTCLLYVAQT